MMQRAPAIGSIEAALSVTKIKAGWYIGKTYGAAFFARTHGELVFKYRRYVLQRRHHLVATADRPLTPAGDPPKFLETHGFGGGQRVRFHRVAGGKHDGRVYIIGMTGYQSDGTPVAWLNGKAGCIPLTQLSHYAPDEGSAA